MSRLSDLFATVALVLVAAAPVALAQSSTALPVLSQAYSEAGEGLYTPDDTTEAYAPNALVPIGNGVYMPAPPVEQPLMRPMTIGNSRQYAPVYEAIYAMRQSEAVYGPPNAYPPIGGPVWNCAVSNWNYLANDPNAFNTVRGWMGSDSSVSGYFGTNSNYALQSNFGRGGQCTFFATLILYRALGGYPIMSREGYKGWYYGNPALNNCPSALNAQPGDIVFYKAGDAGHVALAVQRLNNNTLAVVDSNWVGFGYRQYAVGIYGGQLNSEIIGCHILSVGDQRSTYKVYSGRGRWY